MPSSWLARARLLVAIAIVAAAPLASVLPAGAAETRTGYEQSLRITFPVRGATDYVDTYHAPRDGGARVHQATDIMARKMQRIYAARGGIICYVTGITERVPSWGYMITICGDDGRQYSYIHLNNDDPGTDNGKGGVEYAYAKRVLPGARVVRGQFLGYVGDSGNAEATAPHLHFQIEDPALNDPRIRRKNYDPTRINPYYSLRRAERRGDYPGVVFPQP